MIYGTGQWPSDVGSPCLFSVFSFRHSSLQSATLTLSSPCTTTTNHTLT